MQQFAQWNTQTETLDPFLREFRSKYELFGQQERVNSLSRENFANKRLENQLVHDMRSLDVELTSLHAQHTIKEPIEHDREKLDSSQLSVEVQTKQCLQGDPF